MDQNAIAGMVLGLVLAYVALLGLSCIVAIIRAAINREISGGWKAFWMLLSLLIPFAAIFYFIIPERNRFLRFCGWFMLLSTVAFGGFMGYGAMKNLPSVEIMSLAEPAPDANVAVTPPQTEVVPVEPPPAAEVQQAPVANTQPSQNAPKKLTWALNSDEKTQMISAMLAVTNYKLEADQAKKDAIYNEGIQAFDKIIASNYRNAEAYLYKGMLKEAKKQGSGAEDFNAVVKLANVALNAYSDIPDLYALRAQAYEQLGQIEAGFSDIEKAISMDPQNTEYKGTQSMLELRKMEADALRDAKAANP